MSTKNCTAYQNLLLFTLLVLALLTYCVRSYNLCYSIQSIPIYIFIYVCIVCVTTNSKQTVNMVSLPLSRTHARQVREGERALLAQGRGRSILMRRDQLQHRDIYTAQRCLTLFSLSSTELFLAFEIRSHNRLAFDNVGTESLKMNK